ncbi:MAG: DNA polymerase III subunit beta [Gammaproteobacteria bacterium]|nr:MAG: DNA polymerase III subunit beta [Gammaproteobacteria bacterium]
MKLTVQRETLLKPVQAVIGVVERRQTMPILANVMIRAHSGRLEITATDLEVELVASTPLEIETEGEITVPGRKLLDICRALPEAAELRLEVSGDKLGVRSGRSRFSLSTLPASEFPVIEEVKGRQRLQVAQDRVRRLLEKTQFAMAQQDVRYYLNGMLLEVDGHTLRAVATDGHRLALCEVELDVAAADAQQVIVPRKGVLELQRLLDGEGDLELTIGSSHVRVEIDGIRFTSKLIDGRFPEYGRVIPKDPDNRLLATRDELRQALQRTAILSNEKYRGIRLSLQPETLVIQAHNPEQEEAEEQVGVEYQGQAMEVGFNVNYLLDALGATDGERVQVGLADSSSSCLIHSPDSQTTKFVVMPMRL